MAMSEHRSDPLLILKALHAGEQRQGGQLRIFFGMSAGVGKTYTMLKSAHRALQAGRKIMIGAIDTHGRPETEELVVGIPSVPMKSIDYKGTTLRELDIDEILKVRPEIVIIDELAHHNVPGSRHTKRWQDVIEILDSGIHVWTAVNVQHVESRKDAVEEITGIRIHETIPDHLFDRASEIELVDVTPGTLLGRLREGKIYKGDRAQAAMDNFFRTDHITALREIALRYTASKVDRDLQELIASRAGSSTWRTSERLMVAIDHDPGCERLVRTTRRLAENSNAEWFAVRIDDGTVLGAEDQKNLTKNLGLVQSLGAETVTVLDADTVGALERVARQRNVSQIVIGMPKRPWWHTLYRGGTLFDRLLRKAGDLDIYVVRNESRKNRFRDLVNQLRFESVLSDYLNVSTWLVGVSAIGYFLHPFIGYRAVGFFFLILVLLKGLTKSIGPVVYLAFLSAAVWDVFFIPPFGTLHIGQPEDMAMCASFVIAAVVMGVLIDRTRRRRKFLEQQEVRIQLLLNVSKILVESASDKDIFGLIGDSIAQYVPVRLAIATPNSHEQLRPYYSDPQWIKHVNDWEVAKWTYRNQQAAGRGTDTFPRASALFLTVNSRFAQLGVVGFQTDEKHYITLEEKEFLSAVAHQIALFLERERLLQKSKDVLLFAESERMHQTILNSISHEIRIPLSSIIGFTSTLEEKAASGKGDPKDILDLSRDVQKSALRLNRVVSNLLDMTRISQGKMNIHKDWNDIEDVVDTALNHARSREPATRFEKISRIDGVAVTPFDFSMIEVVLDNLLTNAAHYSLPGAPVLLTMDAENGNFVLGIENEGRKIPDQDLQRIFEKFYRAPGSPPGGTGLGLAICQSIIDFHGGKIWAQNTDKGVRVAFTLPIETQK